MALRAFSRMIKITTVAPVTVRAGARTTRHTHYYSSGSENYFVSFDTSGQEFSVGTPRTIRVTTVTSPYRSNEVRTITLVPVPASSSSRDGATRVLSNNKNDGWELAPSGPTAGFSAGTPRTRLWHTLSFTS